MSGPRITVGRDISQQDYATPPEFIAAVIKRFGPLAFDLAAHKTNAKHERYFAPTELVYKFDPAEHDVEAVAKVLVARGARLSDATAGCKHASQQSKRTPVKVKNYDRNAYGFDAFRHSWADLSKRYLRQHGTPNGISLPGNLWLNCEFDDVEPWSSRSGEEAKKGASVLLLTTAAVGSNWYRDGIAGQADVYHLNGRLCFDGKNPFPKDCMLSHFHPGARGVQHVWEWRKNLIHRSWALLPPALIDAA